MLGSEPPRCLVRKPCLPPRRSNTALFRQRTSVTPSLDKKGLNLLPRVPSEHLEDQGSRWLASWTGDCPRPAGCTPAPSQKTAGGPPPCSWSWSTSVAGLSLRDQTPVKERFLHKLSLDLCSPAGWRLYVSTSQSTSLLGSFLNGSLNRATGIRNMSLLEPSDWYVLEPSKFHSGRSEKKNRETLSPWSFLSQCFVLRIYSSHADVTHDSLGLWIQSPCLAAQPLTGAVNPDVHGLDLVALNQLHVLLFDSLVQLGTHWSGHLDSRKLEGQRFIGATETENAQITESRHQESSSWLKMLHTEPTPRRYNTAVLRSVNRLPVSQRIDC